MENIKRCQYRNCNEVITGNPKKKFCCNAHRTYEHIYEERETTKIKNKSKMYKDLIKESEGNKELIELYKIIYK